MMDFTLGSPDDEAKVSTAEVVLFPGRTGRNPSPPASFPARPKLVGSSWPSQPTRRYPTMKKPVRILFFALWLVAFFLPVLLRGATPGTDTPDSPEYVGGKWESGLNGGKGFLGWNLVTTGPNCGFRIGDSTPSGMAVNTDRGNAFGLYTHGKGNTVDAYRSFDSPLESGQSFQVEMAVNWRNGQKGIDLRRVGDNEVIFNFNVGADDYVVHHAASGNGSLGKEAEGTYQGLAGGVKFYVMDTDSGAENELWFNRLTVSAKQK
ncbi:MAG: hypothetical protein EBT95_02180 [Verrucomicrobia bacterium]|nr:hypothetical protein [Verrucomicrobiota bacterium]